MPAKRPGSHHQAHGGDAVDDNDNDNDNDISVAGSSDDDSGDSPTRTDAAAKASPAADADIPIVAVGASAGGLSAFKQFLSRLPTDTGMAFVLIQHLDPTHDSMLPELLTRGCPLPVEVIADGLVMHPNRVYVIAPGQQVRLLHNQLHCMSASNGGTAQPSGR